MKREAQDRTKDKRVETGDASWSFIVAPGLASYNFPTAADSVQPSRRACWFSLNSGSACHCKTFSVSGHLARPVKSFAATIFRQSLHVQTCLTQLNQP